MSNSGAHKRAIVRQALKAPYSTFYWWKVPGEKLGEAYVNRENSGKFTPSTDGTYTTGNHSFIQVECEDKVLKQYGSYDKMSLGQVARVGDGTLASLQLLGNNLVLVRVKEDTGEVLPSLLICPLELLVGLSILKKYGGKTQNHKF